MSDNLLQQRLTPEPAYSLDTMPLGGSPSARQELRTVIQYGADLVRYAVVHHSRASQVLDEWRRGIYQSVPGTLLTFQQRA